MASLAKQLDALKTAVDEAGVRVSEAKYKADRQRTDAAEEVTADLREFRDDITFKRPGAVPVAERIDRHRQLTHDLFVAVEERGLLAEAANTFGGFGLSITDPAIDTDLEAALDEQAQARKAVWDFESDHSDELIAEVKQADFQRFEEARKAGDLDAIRDALAAGIAPDDASEPDKTHDALVSGRYAGWEDDTSRTEPVAAGDAAAMTSGDLA